MSTVLVAAVIAFRFLNKNMPSHVLIAAFVATSAPSAVNTFTSICISQRLSLAIGFSNSGYRSKRLSADRVDRVLLAAAFVTSALNVPCTTIDLLS